MPRAVALPFLYALAALSWAQGHKPRGSASAHGGSIRKRVHVRPLVNDAGTADLEFDSSFADAGAFSLPARFRYTPPGDGWFWGKTEFSVAADALTSDVSDGHRVTQTSDNITLNLTTEWDPPGNFALAAGPQVTTYARDQTRMRAGGIGIGRFGWGNGNNAGFAASWTGATSPSASNPATTLDLGAGYGRDFGCLTLFGNYTWERSTKSDPLHIFSAGFEWEIYSRFSIDISAQQSPGQHGPQILVGVAIGLVRRP